MIFSTYILSIENIENFLNVPLGAGKLMTTPFSKSFRVEDRMFGWKKWWRNNQSHYNVPNDLSFTGTAYETYSSKTPLLYDGVRSVNEGCSYLP
jgi:hypothetical protein